MLSGIQELGSGKLMQIYKDLLTDMSYATSHEFVQEVYEWNKEQYHSQMNPSTNERIFELRDSCSGSNCAILLLG